MSDRDLRTLERQARSGDLVAAGRLAAAKRRATVQSAAGPTLDLQKLDVRLARDLTQRGWADLVLTSPPYKKRDGWTRELMWSLGRLCARVLRPGGRAWVNFAQLREDFGRPFETRELVLRGGSGLGMAGEQVDMLPRQGLVAGQTVVWVKSLVVDGVQRGHYTPLNSSKTLNYGHELLFTFWKPSEPGGGEPDLDRLSVGVPFADKTNLTRGTRGARGDVHCAGDVWFVPYSTTGATKKKASDGTAHAYSFPEALVEKIMRVSGLGLGSVVLDPFVGSGTTVVVARRLGINAVGYDLDARALAVARERWDLEGAP